MPLPKATYQRINAAGLNYPISTGSATNLNLIDLDEPTQHASHSAAAPAGRSQTLTQLVPGSMDAMSEPTHKLNDKGFIDPFDELVAWSARSQNNASATPQLAPDSSHGPLGLDPLADLWQQDSLPAPDPQQAAVQGTANQPTNHHLDDPWAMDMFETIVATQHAPEQPRAQPAAVEAQPSGLRKTSASSTGDLLQLHSDDEGPGKSRFARTSQAHGVQHNKSPSLPELSAAQGAEVPDPSSSSVPRGEEGVGDGGEQRELFIYAIPLTREKLVFLPIAGWQEEPKPPAKGVTASLSAGITRISESVTTYWNNMGNKDPGSFQRKIHTHGQAVMENMSAEERLMRYIPKAATRVIVYHPASVMPSEVQEQLQKMTSTFLVKATGKAAAAGLLLPVAVGIEMIAVPGTGWYALYQLYKSSVSVKGVNRLNQYLNHASNVRVCYAGLEKLDLYVEKARLSPDGLLTQDDVDDLCHELEEPGLQHPLSELRSRYMKRMQHKTGEYALLPANDTADSPYEGHIDNQDNQNIIQQPPPKGRGSMLAFWK